MLSNFLILAASIFLLVRTASRIRPEAEAVPANPTEDIALQRLVRDELRKRAR
jgi:large-conductance mechanosensitive channel